MIRVRTCGAATVGALLLVLIVASSAMAAGDASMASCPDEALAGFREYLPDCRAYEMVSPPFKDGQEAEGALAVTGDGSQILFEALGAFAGTESDAQGGATYELTRSESGWATSAISPPGSQFPANVLFGASADLGKTLWAARTRSQSIYAKDVYVREADGTFVEVGPMVPPSAEAGPPASANDALPVGYEVIGASSDLSHVLFEMQQ